MKRVATSALVLVLVLSLLPISPFINTAFALEPQIVDGFATINSVQYDFAGLTQESISTNDYPIKVDFTLSDCGITGHDRLSPTLYTRVTTSDGQMSDGTWSYITADGPVSLEMQSIASLKTGSTPITLSGSKLYLTVYVGYLAYDGFMGHSSGEATAFYVGAHVTYEIDYIVAPQGILATPDGSAFKGGNGSKDAPYLIYNDKELRRLSTLVNWGLGDYAGASYRLASDINLNGQPFTPIGSITHPFSGSLDGNGKTIHNLVVNDGTFAHAGLFGYIDADSALEIGRLTIDGAKINEDFVNEYYAYGILAGRVDVHASGTFTVSDCTFRGTIQSRANQGGVFEVIGAGGAIGILAQEGRAATKISKTNVSVTLQDNMRSYLFDNSYIGGLIGEAIDADGVAALFIDTSAVDGTMEQMDRGCGALGGLIGSLHTSIEGIGASVQINECSFNGSMYKGSNSNTKLSRFGGLIGCAEYRRLIITDSYVQTKFYAEVGARGGAGGLLGYADKRGYDSDCRIKRCYVIGTPDTFGVNAGFINNNTSSTESVPLQNCYFDVESFQIDAARKVNTGHLSYPYSGVNVAYENDSSTGVTAAELLEERTFSGWDFYHTWKWNGSYPELRYSGYSLEDKVELDWSIVEKVKLYCSYDVLYLKMKEIEDSVASEEEKRIKICELLRDQGITDVNEAKNYIREEYTARWNCIRVQYNDLYMAHRFKEYIMSPEGQSTRALKAGTALFLNLEILEYASIDTFMQKTPGVKQWMAMLTEFLLEKGEEYKSLKMIDETRTLFKGASKHWSNQEKQNWLDMLNTKDWSVMDGKDTVKLETSWNDCVAACRRNNEVSIIFDKKPQWLEEMDEVCDCTEIAIDGLESIQSYIELSANMDCYDYYIQFLTEIYEARNELPWELCAAAYHLRAEIQNKEGHLIHEIGQSMVSALGTKVLEMDELILGTGVDDFMKSMKFAVWARNQLLDLGDSLENYKYTEGYAWLAEFYQKKLAEDLRTFAANPTEEKAWAFYERYETLRALRVKGEESYLGFITHKILFGLDWLPAGKTDAAAIANENLRFLELCRFRIPAGVKVPTRFDHMQKAIFSCPVDAYVYAPNGELVAALRDGIESNTTNEHGRFICLYRPELSEYSKIVYLKNKDTYSFKLVATDTGYVSGEYRDTSEQATIHSFDNALVASGDLLSVTKDAAGSLSCTNNCADGTTTPIPVYSRTKLAAPTGLAWDATVRGKATWTAVQNASSYAVQLYKGGTAQGAPVSVTGTAYDFTSAINETCSYTFKVTAIGDGMTYLNSDQSAASGEFAVAQMELSIANGSVALRSDRGALQYKQGDGAWTSYVGTLTLTGSTMTDTVSVLSGAHSVLVSDLSITSDSVSAVSVANGAQLDLILNGTNQVHSTGKAGIEVGESGALTITSTSGYGSTEGALNATSDAGGAAIGANSGTSGTITINSGTVTATSETGDMGVGIGGCGLGTDVTTSIKGGTVTAAGNSYAIYPAPAIDSGVTAQGSTNIAGSNAVTYNAQNNDSYKWFKAMGPAFIPSITGVTLSTNAPTVGTAVAATLAPVGASASYQWYTNTTSTTTGGTMISGATLASYAPTVTDEGKYLYCTAIGTGSYSGTVSVVTTGTVSAPVTMVEMPTITPDGGTYTSAQSVMLTCVTTGATIYYTLDGNAPTESSTQYGGTAFTISSSCTVKAKAFKTGMTDSEVASAAFTITPAACTITYNNNGGDGAVDPDTATGGEPFTLPPCAFFAPNGMKFKEWAIGSVTGTKVEAGDSYIFTADTTVYAIWEAIPTYTITYNANGGTGSMPSGTATEGVAFTLPDCTFTAPSGKKFKEWAIGSVDGTRIDAGDTGAFASATTVYAIWEDLATYTVTYDPNGGSGSMPSGTATKDVAFTLPNNTFTPPVNARFKEWAIGIPNSVTRVPAGETHTFSSNTTVYAIWETKLTAPTGIAWDTTVRGKATWTAVPNASSYAVQLYKDGTAQGAPVSVTGTAHDFTAAINAAGAGSYTFRVTAVGNGTSYVDSDRSAASPAYEDEPFVVADVLRVCRYVAGTGSLTNRQLAIFDLSGDGHITVADAVMICRRITGLS